MRQRRSSVASLRRIACAAVLCATPAISHAQGGLSTEGALFLLVPVGARAVGLGQAVVASDLGAESIWANPAGLARLTKNELSINHSQTIVATGDALNVVGRGVHGLLPSGQAAGTSGAARRLSRT